MIDEVYVLTFSYLYEENQHFVFTSRSAAIKFAYEELQGIMDFYQEEIPFEPEDINNIERLNGVSKYSDMEFKLSPKGKIYGHGEIDFVKTEKPT